MRSNFLIILIAIMLLLRCSIMVKDDRMYEINLKISAVLIAFTMLFSAVIMAYPVTGSSNGEPADSPMKGEGFTHDVVLELFVTTWCGYCPSAEAVAKQLNSEYGEHFVFVTMVTDVNDKASQRSDDYQVAAIPDGVFDGGYRREMGGQEGTDTYEGHIEDCGNRDAPAIELSVEAVDNGDGSMDVTYSATYQDMFPFYDAHLRVYIAERVSRYPDVDGHNIPYGFIDYAFDQDVRLPAQTEMTETATWDFENHENATFSNYVIIATLFDKSSGLEGYAVQSATTETTNILISDVEWDPEHPSNDDSIDVKANISGDFTEAEVEYAVCTSGSCGVPEIVPMEIGEDGNYTAIMEKFGSDAESVHFRIVVRDSGGNEIMTQYYDLEFGEGSDEEESFFESDGMFAASGGVIVMLAVVFFALYYRSSSSKDKMQELEDKLAEYEEFQGFERGEADGSSWDDNEVVQENLDEPLTE